MDPTLMYLAQSRHPRRDAEYLSTRERDRGPARRVEESRPTTLGASPAAPSTAWPRLRALLHLHPRSAAR